MITGFLLVCGTKMSQSNHNWGNFARFLVLVDHAEGVGGRCMSFGTKVSGNAKNIMTEARRTQGVKVSICMATAYLWHSWFLETLHPIGTGVQKAAKACTHPQRNTMGVPWAQPQPHPQLSPAFAMAVLRLSSCRCLGILSYPVST